MRQGRRGCKGSGVERQTRSRVEEDGRRKRRRLPPGPRFALPILGHLPLLKKKPLYASLADLAARYGPAVHLRFGGRHAVVVGTAALAKECFSGDLDIAIANRPHFPSVREASFDYSVLTLVGFAQELSISLALKN